MNTYYKFCPNVFLAKCTDKHEKGETIPVETKYGKENDSIVFNLVFERDGFYYYSIVRADGFNVQEHAKRKAEKLHNAASNAEKKSGQYYQKSASMVENIPFGQPILVGHHSEKHHRATIEKSQNAMNNCVEQSKIAENYSYRAEYWEKRENLINESMPESVEYFEFKLEQAKARHEGLKNGTIPRDHSFSLTYAKKEANEIEKKLNICRKLWD